jgi:hypothetical protein
VRLIYLVGAYRSSGDRPHARCWGWYDTLAEAVARMERDKLFFEGTYYTVGIIEAYPYGDFLPVETHWYVPVYDFSDKPPRTHRGVEPCVVPESAKGIIGFLL